VRLFSSIVSTIAGFKAEGSVVAAPVRDPHGTVIAALAVSGATLRLPQARLRVLGRVTVEQAQALTSSLASAQAGA